ncbi:histidine phosphatase family protein [Microvirga sp. STR05]|uniref:Histidine phosphatase family protein n=1 Tax=Hymenobacter duratus TaxID=2771356 RepID=A0ABR8JNI8_9BACT|nr:histidine phosphatase family protein [Hymenobacter duratus]MBD2717296.1 histidine phosphatase family protein [Hymenobacter duratus]MBR7952216.1 histidine phosphatase family protein [Microvirga sp. STR05]
MRPLLPGNAGAVELHAGRHSLVVSHGNTLRALRMQLHGLTVPQVEALEIPTGAGY